MTYDEIVQSIRAEGTGHTIDGYERAQALLAAHHPRLSRLQRKVIAADLSRDASR